MSEVERACASIEDAIEATSTGSAERAVRFPAILCWHELFGWPALRAARRGNLGNGERPLVLIATGFSS